MLFTKNKKNVMIGLMMVLCFMLILPNIAMATFGDYTSNFSFVDSSPRGVCTDGTYLYIGGDVNNKIFRYDFNGTETDFNFSTISPVDIACNTTHFAVLDSSGNVVLYNSTGDNTGFNFSVSSQGSIERGIAMNDTNFWYATGSSFNIYRYFSNGTTDGTQFDPRTCTGDGVLRNINFNGTYMFGNHYNTPRDSFLCFMNGTQATNFSSSSQDTQDYGFTTNGTYFFVAGDDNNLVYLYEDNEPETSTNISDCINVTSPNLYYDVIAELNDTQAGEDYCILLKASNITLDCHGHNITGSQASDSIGIFALIDDDDYTNITIKDCNIEDYKHGMRIDGDSSYTTDLINITNNTVYDSGTYAFIIDNIEDSFLTYNDIYNTSTVGLYLSYSDNVYMGNNQIRNGSNYGLFFNYVNNSNLENTVIEYNGGYGAYVSNTINTSEANNTYTDSGNYDFHSTSSVENYLVSENSYNGTIASFELTDEIYMKYSSGTASPIGYSGISKYLNITGDTDTLMYLNMSYEDSDLGGVTESTLTLWDYNGTAWTEVSGSAVDTVNNIVYGNISLSDIHLPLIFAPLGIESTPIQLNVSYPTNISYKWTDGDMFVRVDYNDTVDACWVEEDGTTNHSMSLAPEDSATTTITGQAVGSHTLIGFCNDTVGEEYSSDPVTYTWVDTNVSDCLNITNSGLYYDMNASMVDTQGLPSNDYCIRVQASNVTLDCHGYNMSGSLTGTGIWATISGDNYTNITIKNCKVVSYQYGIRVNGISTFLNSLINITNNTANSNDDYGFAIDRVRDSSVTFNEGVDNKIGLYASNNNNTYYGNNLATNNTDYGIYFDDCDYSDSENNVLNYNDDYGFYIATTSVESASANDSFIGNGVFDFYSSSANDNFIASELDFNGVIASFEYDLDMGLKYSEAIASPTDYSGISKYLNITNASDGWLYLNVSYEDSDLGDVTESTLTLWRNNGTWYEVTGSGVDTVNNIVYGNISSFSIFAPLGTEPDTFDETFINIMTAFMVLIVIIGIFLWITKGSPSMEQIVGLLLIGMALAIIIASALA